MHHSVSAVGQQPGGKVKPHLMDEVRCYVDKAHEHLGQIDGDCGGP